MIGKYTYPKSLWVVLLAASAIGLATSCSTPKDAETNKLADPIKIDTGYISGTLIGDVGKEVRIYRGIPYAASPVGNLRWKPPQPASSWSGIRECTVFSKVAPQSNVPSLTDLPQSEDCLHLNVLTPAIKASDSLPVMVWLHGGGYYGGSGNEQIFHSQRLPQNSVVLVTVNTRLGPLGLLVHPLLSKESPRGISGNYMFFDMVAALQWVQRNIAAFGGNQKNVTIFGVSGGGSKVACLMASPLAKGLFQRAIIESGPTSHFMPGTALKDLEALSAEFFIRLGIGKEADPLKAAHALPLEKIVKAGDDFEKELNNGKVDRSFEDSAIDEYFLTDTLANIFRAGKQNSVPLITCANLGELTGPGALVMPFLVPEYVNLLNGVNATGQKGYACIFDQVPSKWKKDGCVSVHGIEQSYVFGDWDNASGNWLRTFNLGAREAGAKTPDPGLTDIDKKVSENMMAMWGQFARTGNPNIEGRITWPAYSSDTDQYLYIAEPMQVKSGFSKVAQKR